MVKIEQNKFHYNSGKTSFAQGFTLIELVMVIVILGILSAFALPRFADMSTDARVSTLESLEGAMRSATSLVHTKAIIENKTDCSADPSVEMEGATITLRCGYPCPHPNGIGNAPDPGNCKIRYTSARTNRPPGISSVTGGC